MLNIKKTIENGNAVYTLEGRLDTVTAPDLENDLKESLTKQYADQDAYEIESFTAGVYDDVNIYRYVVNHW